MRRIPLFLSLLSPFIAFSQSQTFEIVGTIKGQYNSKVFLFYDDNYRQKDSISAEIKDGRFYIKANAPLPIQGRLHLDQASIIQDVYIDDKKLFISCTNKINFTGENNKDTLNWFMVTSVKGSKSENLKREFENWLIALKASGKTEEEKKQAYYDKLYAFVQQHPASKVSPYLVAKASTLSESQISALNTLIDGSLTNTFEGKSIVKLLRFHEKANNKPIIGDPFHDVELKDTAGMAVNTKDLRGKYVLVDFWTSSCKPCRESFPALKRLYDSYKGKDFEVLTVSFDQFKNKWKEAIIKDRLPWKQAIDEKNFSGILSNKYGIQFVPFSILLDKEGKIIGADLSAKELEELIAKLL